MKKKEMSQKILQQITTKLREKGNSKVFHIETYAANKDNTIIFAQYHEILGREPEGKYILIVDCKTYFIETKYFIHKKGEKRYLDGSFWNGQINLHSSTKIFNNKNEFMKISKIANNSYKILHDSSLEFVFPSTAFGYNKYF